MMDWTDCPGHNLCVHPTKRTRKVNAKMRLIDSASCVTGSVPFSKTTFGVVAVDQALHLSILSMSVAMLS